MTERPLSAAISTVGPIATRRGSLIVLGNAALAAVTSSAANGAVMASKQRKRKGKGKNKTRGNSAKRCGRQVAGCEGILRDVCTAFPECVVDDLLPCCAPLSDCEAGDAVVCMLAYFNPND